MVTSNSNLESLVESFGQLFEMQNVDNDCKAAALYRAMFVNDKDINKLDFNYADHILGYVESGNKNAVIDYKNYLQYLEKIVPNEYQSHLQMFEEAMNKVIEEDEV